MRVLEYHGTGPAGVRIPGVGEVRRGQTLHVPDEIAEQLLARDPDTWKEHKAKAKGTKKGGAGEAGASEEPAKTEEGGG